MMKPAGLMALVALGLTFSATAQAQTTKRTELTKRDLTGMNMEVVVGTIEAAPATTAILHTHAGEEAVYVLNGATALTPDGKPIMFGLAPPGSNVGAVPRGAFTVSHVLPLLLPMTAAANSHQLWDAIL